MKFVNTSGVDLDFELAGTRYQVRPHETIDVPDRYAYAVAKHGLPLTPDGDVPPMGGTKPKAAVVPTVVDDENGDDPPPFSEPGPADQAMLDSLHAAAIDRARLGAIVATQADSDAEVDVRTDEDGDDPPADEVEGVDDPGVDDAEDSTASDETPLDAQAEASQPAAPRLTKKQRKALAAGK